MELLALELGFGSGSRVVDLGAGTGKLTRQLVATGADVVAVEPIPEMRAHIEKALPRVEALTGTAEDLPLANHSVDAVLVAQAFHWFDALRAMSEIRRVLKPGGGLGLIWQARDASVPWVARLNEIIDAADDGHPRFRTGEWREAFDNTALFEPLQEATLASVQNASPDEIVDRVASISYIAAMRDEDREQVLADVRHLLATDPATATLDRIDLPHVVHVYWTRVRAIPDGPSTGMILSVNTSPGGVPKRPIGRGRIRWRGVEGDRHATPEPIHGTPAQAVCLHAFEAIERIRADGHQAFPGAYGENLTLAGLDWKGLRHGDRLRIGDAGPLLELTDYTVPCAQQERWFLEGRTGRISHRRHPEDARWYARVVEEGDVAPGDVVHLIRTV
ncbi:MAG TPA: methyltransferase domain-containing protein [Candidatus Limnocylindrales bacterium]|nr:methyltransferase domain-containing protein [Candidatus Limnocylindrales bacterium]